MELIIRKKILVIDDDAIHLTLANEILKRNYDVYTAKSGEEALDYMKKGNIPDIILLDIIMPQMNGWEVFSKIKGIGLLKNIPIVFITAMDNESDVQTAQRMGAADYITKPFSRKKLLSSIARLIK